MDVQTASLYALKIIKHMDNKKKGALAALYREIAAMKTASHPCVVPLIKCIEDRSIGKVALIMGWAEGGPALTREGLEAGHTVPEPLTRFYCRDMVRAVHHIHQQGLIHGDLKPENVLMCASGKALLSDFGCAKQIESTNQMLHRSNGTPAFLAPEMTVAKAQYAGEPADVYALGASLYTFAYGRIPFTASTVQELFTIVQTQPLQFPDSPVISQELKDLLLGLLEKRPEHRLTLQQVAQHPWITEHGQYPLPLSSSCADPIRQVDHLACICTPDIQVVQYEPGAHLSKLGGLLLIMEGQVKVIYTLSDIQPPKSPPLQLASLSTPSAKEQEEDVDVDVDYDNDTPMVTDRTYHSTSSTMVLPSPGPFGLKRDMAPTMEDSFVAAGDEDDEYDDTKEGSDSSSSDDDDGSMSDVEASIPPPRTTTTKTTITPPTTTPPPPILPAELEKALIQCASTSAAVQCAPYDYLVATRGEGDIVGEMGLLAGRTHSSSATVRRRCGKLVSGTTVKVAVIPRAKAKDYLRRNPLAKQQLAEMMWQRQAETIRIEAIARLGVASRLIIDGFSMN
jgi:[calcium/calmodulin-dependent protein kinase] kinase